MLLCYVVWRETSNSMTDEDITLFAETAAFFELVSTTLNKNQKVPLSHKDTNEKLEMCWVKLQHLIENNKDLNDNSKMVLQETQQMVRILCERKNTTNDVPIDKKPSSNKVADEPKKDKRHSAIESTISTPGTVTFQDIAGLADAKTLLKEAVVLPLQYPHLFTGKRKPWRSILLYGPPGTGKSRMAQAVASEIDSTFYSVSSSDLLSSWFGESEKLIKELFEHARTQSTRAIIFIDEIDSLCRKRDSKEAETTRRVKTELLKQLEGANKHSGVDIFFLCATNCPWELDTAFLRRFEKRIYILLPDRHARKELFKIHLGDVNIEISEEEWERMLDITEGYSGSDLATCISDALLEPIRGLDKTKFWKWSEDKSTLRPADEKEVGAVRLRLKSIPKDKIQPRPLTYTDLTKSLKSNHRTVSHEELNKYESFTESFGQNG